MKGRKYWKREAESLARELESGRRWSAQDANRRRDQVRHLETLLREHGVRCECTWSAVDVNVLGQPWAVSRPQRVVDKCPIHSFGRTEGAS